MGNGILQLPGLRDLSVCLACLLAFLLFCFGNKKEFERATTPENYGMQDFHKKGVGTRDRV